MLNIPKNFEMDHNRMKRDLLTAYRRITWKIWVYLKANPEVLGTNNNQEIFDQVAKVQTNYYLRRNPNQTREEAFSMQDFISDLEAKYNAEDYYFGQETLDLFRPSTPHDKEWGWQIYVELFFYSMSPESYTKSVHELVLEEEEFESNPVAMS